MYSIYDYAYNGLLYLNNIMRPRHKRLSQLMIYSTTACQSRCKHCNIWQKPVEHLSLDDIRRIMQSKCITKRTIVGLEGGEFILHPQAAEIMAWFQEHHSNYTLLSNCLAPHRVIDAVRRYQPWHLYVSLDGGRETYQRMRGRDGYDRVIQVVEALKDEVPLSCYVIWSDCCPNDSSRSSMGRINGRIIRVQLITNTSRRYDTAIERPIQTNAY